MAALFVLAILIGAFAPLDAKTTTAPPAEKSTIPIGIETTEKLVATTQPTTQPEKLVSTASTQPTTQPDKLVSTASTQPTTQAGTEMTDKLVSTTGENEGTSTTQAQTMPTEVTPTMKREELTTLKKFVITCTPNGGQVGAEPFIRPVFVVIVTYLAMLAV
uniref:Uncharacterized protein n=1 Tax=Globodera rostochiensis TaxID=31243 RepID=A0A914H759_GLORO